MYASNKCKAGCESHLKSPFIILLHHDPAKMNSTGAGSNSNPHKNNKPAFASLLVNKTKADAKTDKTINVLNGLAFFSGGTA